MTEAWGSTGLEGEVRSDHHTEETGSEFGFDSGCIEKLGGFQAGVWTVTSA